VIGVALVLATPGYAAFPGLNGKIAFERSDGVTDNLRTIDSDGTDEAVLPTANDYAAMPSWSADGRKVAYSCWLTGVCVKTIGGSDFELYEGYGDSANPSFSPDGSTVVFSEGREACPDPSEPDFCFIQADLAKVPADTFSSSSTLLTDSEFGDEKDPSWSPDGGLIAYCCIRFIEPDETAAGEIGLLSANQPDWSSDGNRLVYSRRDGGDDEIFVVRRDGTQNTKLTDNAVHDAQPVWSPDSSKIAFASNEGGDWEIYVMKADGTGRQPITDNTADDLEPSWQPLAPTGYPRPKSARVGWTYLVPAYPSCTAPDRTHGPPLAHGSCSDPRQISSHLTVGTPDANGRPANATGLVRYGARIGDPATPADEADLNFILTVRDVRAASDLADYEGELELRVEVRLTDRASGPGATEPATVTDFDFAVPFPCAATADTTTGSDCALSTTAEALMPGAVGEGDRSIWAQGRARVYDGGPDGVAATPDNHIFLVQGIFVP
jgi:hypothetical protein